MLGEVAYVHHELKMDIAITRTIVANFPCGTQTRGKNSLSPRIIPANDNFRGNYVHINDIQFV